MACRGAEMPTEESHDFSRCLCPWFVRRETKGPLFSRNCPAEARMLCELESHLGSPDLASENPGHPLKPEFQINREYFVSIIISCEISGTYLY